MKTSATPHRLPRRQFILSGLASAALAALPLRAAEPIGTARIFVGFPPGGTTDTLARRVAEKLRGRYANSVIVDNRPGGAGQVAVTVLKSSAADGSALLLTPASMLVLYPHTYQSLPYRTFEDVTPVSTGAYFAFGFGVGPMVPGSVRNLSDFLSWAKANPARANYASPGAGAMPHMVGALLAKLSGVALNHVPYRGSAPGLQDLLGGHIAAMSSPLGDYLPHAKAGKLRLLAVTGTIRSPFAPDIATYAEQGFTELTMREWFGFFLPGKAKAEVVDAAFKEIKKALAEKDVADALAGLGLDVQPSASPQELAATLRTEHELWAAFVKRAGFTAQA
jgi:tripartite-type tricarboxylate transporter receptor subunit TctC